MKKTVAIVIGIVLILAIALAVIFLIKHAKTPEITTSATTSSEVSSLRPTPPDSTAPESERPEVTTAPDTSSEAPTTSEDPSQPTSPESFLVYSIEMLGRYGDATLIKYGDYEILVDGGNSVDAPAVKAALDTYVTDDMLELLIVSHPDADHIDGLENRSTFAPLEGIGMIVQNGDTRGNAAFESVVTSLFPNAIFKTIVEVMADDSLFTIEIDDEFSLTFLDQKNYYDASASKNDKSIAFIIEYKNAVLFMGGDMESSACNSLMAKNPDLVTDEQFVIYKLLHHGSMGTNSAAFLSYLKPDLAFVSTGMSLASDKTPNFSAHPYPEALFRVAPYTTDIYWSSLSGDLSIVCDGYDAEVSGAGRSTEYYYKTKTDVTPIKADRDAERSIPYFKSRFYLVGIEYKGYRDYLNVLS